MGWGNSIAARKQDARTIRRLHGELAQAQAQAVALERELSTLRNAHIATNVRGWRETRPGMQRRTCAVCGEPASSWTWYQGRGPFDSGGTYTVQPCGHRSDTMHVHLVSSEPPPEQDEVQ